MKRDIEDRVIDCALHIIDSNDTIRKTADVFSVSKSTVHKDLSYRLAKLDPALYKEVRKILERNKAERHLRGGMATSEKYRNIRKGRGIFNYSI